MDYKELTAPDGEDVNMGGTQQTVYFAPVSHIGTYPAAATTEGANPYVMTTPFVMKQGKKFIPMYTTQDMSDLDFGSNGEADGKSFKPVLKLFYPGLTDDALLFINNIKNDKIILLVPLANGKVLQLGNGQFFMTVSPNFKTGTVSGRGIGTEIEVMGYLPYIYRYAAAIPLVAAT
ncbi:hypothetical protein [Spirosoma sp.]|uniref:hypothetical protein n=1 Tax=Spirosoma sp. TaxID=1899569 RepID=UPI00261DE404|nr:hypothetical protein [Spirosoma sp.]MCX6216477.1 hypothetical protein [Spirosoma sp.]